MEMRISIRYAIALIRKISAYSRLCVQTINKSKDRALSCRATKAVSAIVIASRICGRLGGVWLIVPSLDYFINLAISLFIIQVVNFHFAWTGVCQVSFPVHVS